MDAAPKMLARAKARVGAYRVRFIQADLFAWTPDRRYDVVFFSSWISRVPLDRFDAFWLLSRGLPAAVGTRSLWTTPTARRTS